MSENVTVLRPGMESINLTSGLSSADSPSFKGGNGGGGDDMQIRVARLESDVEYIKRDISEVKSDIKAIDSRLTKIETGIESIKTTIKASAAVVSVAFAFCVYVFGNYVSKIIDALNGLILK
ncbi:hypothetical protein [Shimwellia blattae]|uniref:hypothetical protein n=1 Tax=Shimwellia blattae TaxID=563 RepID=UPI0002910FD6|nr:hypothetical protein [Shimwellia blattae]GAB80511.1 hypothetical protein EB105725_05_02390 [Shimwellia blattae DSM 4481 = NBRC 105725]